MCWVYSWVGRLQAACGNRSCSTCGREAALLVCLLGAILMRGVSCNSSPVYGERLLLALSFVLKHIFKIASFLSRRCHSNVGVSLIPPNGEGGQHVVRRKGEQTCKLDLSSASWTCVKNTLPHKFHHEQVRVFHTAGSVLIVLTVQPRCTFSKALRTRRVSFRPYVLPLYLYGPIFKLLT